MHELYRDKDWELILDEAPLLDGRTKKAVRVKRADSAHILAFNDEGKLLLIHEYRPFYHAKVWMLPSGRIDKENDIAAGAMRELQEETGYRADELTPLWTVSHSESLIMQNHFFLAKKLVHDPLPQDVDEHIEVEAMDIKEALHRVQTSAKVHVSSAYGILRYLYECM